MILGSLSAGVLVFCAGTEDYGLVSGLAFLCGHLLVSVLRDSSDTAFQLCLSFLFLHVSVLGDLVSHLCPICSPWSTYLGGLWDFAFVSCSSPFLLVSRLRGPLRGSQEEEFLVSFLQMSIYTGFIPDRLGSKQLIFVLIS